jgi:hypothetical protein
MLNSINKLIPLWQKSNFQAQLKTDRLDSSILYEFKKVENSETYVHPEFSTYAFQLFWEHRN